MKRVHPVPSASVSAESSTWSLSSLRHSFASDASAGLGPAFLGRLKPHRAICRHIPLTSIVAAVTTFALVVPVVAVSCINIGKLSALSAQRRDEALLRRAESSHQLMTLQLARCEGLAQRHAQWAGSLPETADEYGQLVGRTGNAWASASLEPVCGKNVAIYVRNGFMLATRSSSDVAVLQPCFASTARGMCWATIHSWNSTLGQYVATRARYPADASTELSTQFRTIEALGQDRWGAFQAGTPVWKDIATNPVGTVISTAIFAPITQNRSSRSPTGIVVISLKPEFLSESYVAAQGSGIAGVFLMAPDGLMMMSSMENITAPDARYNNTRLRLIRANESSLEVVRRTFADLQRESLQDGQTAIRDRGDYVVATTAVVSAFGLRLYIATVGDKAFFDEARLATLRASGAVMGAAVVVGGAAVVVVVGLVLFGLRRIERTVLWLRDDLVDGEALNVRNSDGEVDMMAVLRAQQRQKAYELTVWFSELDRVGTAVDEVAACNRELKLFFPSVFVGMSKEDFDKGVHKTQLRFKNVSVMFVDIVKFSAHCVEREGSLQTILQVFLSGLESPVFKHKGLTKRLGDGFMAAFGFATADDDPADLCKRAFMCSRLIVRNLPRVNKELRKRVTGFPSEGLKLRIGISTGKASIGVVHTENMSNADVYGAVVNLAQRMEDSGRYKGGNSEAAVLLAPDETPMCVTTVTPEVHEQLEATGEPAKYGVEWRQRSVFVKNEAAPRAAWSVNDYEHHLAPEIPAEGTDTTSVAESSGLHVAF
eukprot:m51a1_g10047 hypothetical protein (770) ;mRNA; r:35049-37534